MLKTVGVMGPSGRLTSEQRSDAFEIGKLVAQRGFVLVTGGLSGVMEVASAGAKNAGGLVLGICPVGDKQFVNEYVDIAVMTSMGGGRNYMNILSSDVVIAIGCNRSAGTLSEIAFSLQSATPLMVMRPPLAMRQFLESFNAAGQARFGESADDVGTFLTEAFAELEERARRAERARG